MYVFAFGALAGNIFGMILASQYIRRREQELKDLDVSTSITFDASSSILYFFVFGNVGGILGALIATMWQISLFFLLGIR